MLFGKQYRYCPNCGKRLYDSLISMHAQSMLCSKECREEWELKYARAVLGKSAEPDTGI
jgi:hypothetical protein